MKGYLAIVLHAHLPYIRHPEFDDFLEEDWLFEAITETYIPLIRVLDGLARDKVDYKLTISLSPTLMSMLMDPHLQSKYIKHIEKLIELSAKEIERTKWDERFNRLAHMYHNDFCDARRIFVDEYGSNLVNAFKRFQDLGNLEVITCCATHGYLPLMEVERRASVRAQVKVGTDMYQKVFGRKPAGIWLPECGYNPGDDEMLKKEGIRYFLVDTHGILFGKPRPRFGVFSGYLTKNGVGVFGRDTESSKAVWSAVEGYPGDYNYREFYRDIGFDLDYDYVRPYINADGVRINTGIKYHRITGTTSHKEPYNQDAARETAAKQAANFMFNREKQVEYLAGSMGDRLPVIVAPYDAELFGHWWYEGPQWLDFLIRKIRYDQKTVALTTPGEYLKLYKKYQVLTPSHSSWGWKGYSEVWLEGSNDWVYRHMHKMVERMVEVATANVHAKGLLCRALNQMARELLLAQSSDWAFIMKTGSHVPYAVARFREHTEHFTELYNDIKQGTLEEEYIRRLEDKYNIFPDIDYSVYSA
ncbi:MAG: 1,4-alpha-glucan branching protein domain-containing protein [Candidatus Omnitrophota bacterium]|jgi:1,4-alpha-glucan branching enzyme